MGLATPNGGWRAVSLSEAVTLCDRVPATDPQSASVRRACRTPRLVARRLGLRPVVAEPIGDPVIHHRPHRGYL